MGMIWVGYRRRSAEAREILQDSDRLEDLLESDDGDTSVDLDKAWHGLHWLLARSGEVASRQASEAIFGGEPIGEDLGYGPGRLLATNRVRAVAEALREIDVDVLRMRMDSAAMTSAEVYPAIWDEADVFDTSIAPAYEDLRAFYEAAAGSGEAVIQTIC